jgi:LAS superfamily LD-carboxypeptidase LdcB
MRFDGIRRKIKKYHTSFFVSMAIVGVGLLLMKSGWFVTNVAPAIPYTDDLLSLVIAKEFSIARSWLDRGITKKTLQVGQRGTDVRILQSFLAEHEQLLDTEYVTGYFGNLTAQSVTKFQRREGLPQTGVMDAITAAHIEGKIFAILCPISDEQSLPLTIPVSRTEPLPLSYIPPTLTRVPEQYSKQPICITAETLDAFVRMSERAERDGVKLLITSGYRHPQIQQMLVDFWTTLEGEEVYAEIALPGYSEHQLGTAIDVTGPSISYLSVHSSFADTPEYTWLIRNASRYGFVLSYPKNHAEYNFEPWHWRYVGTKAARVQ